MLGAGISAVQRVELSHHVLDDEGQAKLLKLLSAGGSTDCAQALLEHVLRLGAFVAMIECPYTDQDYSADFVSFYASAFKSYPRYTKRVHFFAGDVAPLLSLPLGEQAKAFAEGPRYLGFCVVRPLSQGPIGRTVLRFPTLEGLTVRRAARAKSKVHPLAIELEIEGAPFIQQDTRVGACAQAAIWMASRPLFERHGRIGWHSVSQITSFATTPTDHELSRSLPHGSRGLSPLHIIRALVAMGHQPYSAAFGTDACEDKEAGPKGKGDAAETPGTSEPEGNDATAAFASVVRYLDSGLPVILGLTDPDPDRDGHAVTAVGYAEVNGAAVRASEGYDAFVRAFVVHDDQRGPYRLMPLRPDDVEHLPSEQLLRFDKKIVTAEDWISHIFVPLSPRVFLVGDKADALSWDFVEQQMTTLASGSLHPQLAQLDRAEVDQLQAFCDAWQDGRVIRRVYLTTAGRYRHHLASTKLSEAAKQMAIAHKLPHFVWVCELLYADSCQKDSGGPRDIVGHIVMNATSSTDLDGDLLFAHLPCLVVQRDVDPPPGHDGEYLERGTVVAGTRPYAQRVRR